MHDVRTKTSGEATELSASHDGYKQRGHGVVHHRAWRLAAKSLSVTDTLSGAFSTAEVRFHFAPGQLLAYDVAGGSAHIESGTWHPRFGDSVSNSVLVVRFTQPRCHVTFAWD